MAAPTYICWAADTSASVGPPASVASAAVAGTVKTILQIKSGAPKMRIVEWGYTLEAAPAAPLRVELVETGVINATVTTIGSGVRLHNDVTGPASQAVAGTAATGFNATAEGSIVASRLLDFQWENGIYFKKQWPLGREPEVNASSILRVRATPSSAVAVNIMPYVVWEE